MTERKVLSAHGNQAKYVGAANRNSSHQISSTRVGVCLREIRGIRNSGCVGVPQYE